MVLGTGNRARVEGHGTVEIKIIIQGKVKICKLENVLHVSAFGYQLISISQLDKLGISTTFKNGRC